MASVSKSLLSLLAIESGTEGEGQVNQALEKLAFLILFTVLQRAGCHARIAHRAKINVFDVLRSLLSLNYSPRELKVFLLWCRFQGQKQKSQLTQPLIDEKLFRQDCQVKLEFAPIPPAPPTKIPPATTSLANISGCLFYPPIPPAFTYKFTPVSKNYYCAVNSLPFCRFMASVRMTWWRS